MKEGSGEYKYAAGSFRPEYETVAMFGPNCLNNNLESILKVNDICNRFGIDTISAGSAIAFAMECYEKGLITRKDTDGIEMNFGNHRSLVAMTEKLASREGFGDVLADGVRAAAQKVGGEAEKYAIHIHGQEVPGHSPIKNYFWTATYIAGATPARHTQGSEGMMPGFIPGFDKNKFSGRGKAHKTGVCFQNSLMCSGMCLFVLGSLPNVHVMAEFLRSVTGWDITTDELLVTGERIENMRHCFNLREGVNLLQHDIPGRIIGQPPHTRGTLAGITVDADTMIKEYLAEMDWNIKTARPSHKKLIELGLNDIARALRK
jgi:aldehyde:ferredoxin oxidoreductase